MKTSEELRRLVGEILLKSHQDKFFILDGRCANELMELIQSELYDAYQDGAAAAQSTACEEIARNYVAIK
jgi:hypothetical protein